MHTIIMTNNPQVRDIFTDRYETEYRDCPYEALLTAVRDRVHKGAVLLTHPLYGSVKPKETPYRSVLLGMADDGNRTDARSVMLIEDALAAVKKFRDKAAGYDEKLLADCRAVDLSLFEGALRSVDGAVL